MDGKVEGRVEVGVYCERRKDKRKAERGKGWGKKRQENGEIEKQKKGRRKKEKKGEEKR